MKFLVSSSGVLKSNVSDVRLNGWLVTPTYGYNLQLASDFSITGYGTTASDNFTIHVAHETIPDWEYPSSETMYDSHSGGRVRDIVLDSLGMVISWADIKQREVSMQLTFSGIRRGESTVSNVSITLGKEVMMDDTEAVVLRDISQHFEQSDTPIILKSITNIK